MPTNEFEPRIPIHRPDTLPDGCRWHEIETPQQRIGFMLRTSRRKTIGLTISDQGLLVTTPPWVPRKQVMDVVQSKAPWVLSKLRALHLRQSHLATEDERWREGGRFPYLGVQVRLALQPESDTARYTGHAHQPTHDDVLVVPAAADSAAHEVRERVHAWLQQQALEGFGERLAYFCRLADASLAGWRLGSPRARWGSCSSDGRIMLNWRLIHFPPEVLDYVVAHEVAHLRHMNHGSDFWRLVERLYPDYRRARQALRPHHPGSLPRL